MVKLALYKGKGVFPGSYLIRFWNNSIYSHCELVIDNLCYSSSLMDRGVRAKKINLTAQDWDLIDLPWADEQKIKEHYEKTKDDFYDVWGLIGSQIFNKRSDSVKAAFCSEWCAAALELPNPETYSPHTLGDMCNYKNRTYHG